jgi:hypothetical protein
MGVDSANTTKGNTACEEVELVYNVANLVKIRDDQDAKPIEVGMETLCKMIYNHPGLHSMYKRDFSVKDGNGKEVREKRFRFVITKNKMFAAIVKRHGLGEVGLDTAQQPTIETILGDKFYCRIFNNEEEAIGKMWSNDDMWHIILIGFPEVLKTPSERFEVVGALSFVLNPEKEKGSIISWFCVSDENCDPTKWLMPGRKRSKTRTQFDFFSTDNCFRGGCGIGTTLFCIYQKLCEELNGSAGDDNYAEVPNEKQPDSPQDVYRGLYSFRPVDKEAMPKYLHKYLIEDPVLTLHKSTGMFAKWKGDTNYGQAMILNEMTLDAVRYSYGVDMTENELEKRLGMGSKIGEGLRHNQHDEKLLIKALSKPNQIKARFKTDLGPFKKDSFATFAVASVLLNSNFCKRRGDDDLAVLRLPPVNPGLFLLKYLLWKRGIVQNFTKEQDIFVQKSFFSHLAWLAGKRECDVPNSEYDNEKIYAKTSPDDMIPKRKDSDPYEFEMLFMRSKLVSRLKDVCSKKTNRCTPKKVQEMFSTYSKNITQDKYDAKEFEFIFSSLIFRTAIHCISFQLYKVSDDKKYQFWLPTFENGVYSCLDKFDENSGIHNCYLVKVAAACNAKERQFGLVVLKKDLSTVQRLVIGEAVPKLSMKPPPAIHGEMESTKPNDLKNLQESNGAPRREKPDENTLVPSDDDNIENNPPKPPETSDASSHLKKIN